MKYIIQYSTKGGVGKTTFAKLLHTVLARLERYKVTGEDLDPQQHYADWLAANPELVVTEKEADFFLYDTQGAHTDTNKQLLQAVKNVDALIIVPVRPSVEDVKEARRIGKRLAEAGVLDKAIFVLNGCHHSKDYNWYIAELKMIGAVAKKRINTRSAFAETPRNKELSDFSQLVHEVIL